VNSQHSQGTGLQNFEAVSGSYAATHTDLSLDSSGLTYQDKIITDDGDGDSGFTLWVEDGGGVNSHEITIDDNTTLEGLVGEINNVTGINAQLNNDNIIEITTNSSEITFAFSNDTSNVLAALGINTFFTGDAAGNMGVNDTVISGGDFIAAGLLDGTGTRTVGDNSNAMAIADLQFTSMTVGDAHGGTVGVLETTAENFYHTLLGSVGTLASGISMNKDTSEAMVRQLTDMRDSFSGVSLDEEMINLMTSQSAYAAAAKLITTADEMLDTLLRMK